MTKMWRILRFAYLESTVNGCKIGRGPNSMWLRISTLSSAIWPKIPAIDAVDCKFPIGFRWNDIRFDIWLQAHFSGQLSRCRDTLSRLSVFKLFVIWRQGWTRLRLWNTKEVRCGAGVTCIIFKSHQIHTLYSTEVLKQNHSPILDRTSITPFVSELCHKR